MKKQAYQVPELRDASNNIIQAGTYGRTSPLVNADNTGILDYVNNNLEALHDAQQTGNGVRAAADINGQTIDIAALKKLITDTVTQAKKDAILAAHPVGSYYISDNATDPGTLFGGTWKMLAPGLTLISQGKGTDKFGSFEFVAGQTYGERLHQLTVDELPRESPYGILSAAQDGGLPLAAAVNGGAYEGRLVVTNTVFSSVVHYGGGKMIGNIPPAVGAYVWCRTA